MRKPLVALLATTAIVFAACGGATTPSPSATEPAATETPTEGPSPTPTVRLDDSTYGTRVEEGTDGGQIIIGDWQEANIFNPFYLGQVTEANVASAAWATLVVLTDDLQLRAGPRDGRADHRQRRRQGARRRRRRDDGHVDASRRPQVVGRRAAHLRRLHVRLRVGHGPRQRRRHHHRLTDISEIECASDTEMIQHFSEGLRGLHHPQRGAPAAALPRGHPDGRPGQRRRLPGRRSRRPAGHRRVQVRVGHAGRGAAPGPQRQLHELGRPASRPTSTPSSSSGTATPTP